MPDLHSDHSGAVYDGSRIPADVFSAGNAAVFLYKSGYSDYGGLAVETKYGIVCADGCSDLGIYRHEFYPLLCGNEPD